LVCYCSISGIGAPSRLRHKRENGGAAWWLAYSSTAVSGVALCWFPPALAYQVGLAFAFLCVAISGAVGGGAYLPVALVLDIPTLTPLTVRFLLEPDFVHLALALGSILMMALILYYARQHNRLIVDSLNARFENQELNDGARTADHSACVARSVGRGS
jgi:hypothetical protein